MPQPNIYHDEIFKIMPRWDKFINLMLNIKIPQEKWATLNDAMTCHLIYMTQWNFAYWRSPVSRAVLTLQTVSVGTVSAYVFKTACINGLDILQQQQLLHCIYWILQQQQLLYYIYIWFCNTHCWLGGTPSRRTIIVRPMCPVREHSKLAGLDFLRQVRLEWRFVISASNFSPLKVASSLVRWILATPNTIRRVRSPVTTPVKATTEEIHVTISADIL